MTLSNVGNRIPRLLWWRFDLLPLQNSPTGGNVISADLFLTWLTVMRIKCTCKYNLGGGGCRRNTQQEPKDLRHELESLCTDIKKRHKRYKSKLDTWGQSNTSVSSYNLHPLPPFYCSHPTLTPAFAGLSSPLSPPTHYTFCFRFSSSLLVTSPPTAAALRPRHPTLPNAADINQLLCGKQREGWERGRDGRKRRKPRGSQWSELMWMDCVLQPERSADVSVFFFYCCT